MSRLLEVYDEMIKEAELSKMAEEVQFMFEKYAETANEELAKEYGSDYTQEDVESLAQGLMEHDAALLEEQEKVAEYDAIGREMAHQYMAELEKEAGVPGHGFGQVVKTVKTVAKKAPKKAAGTATTGAKSGPGLLDRVTKWSGENPIKAGLIGGGAVVGTAAAGSMLANN